MIELTRENLPKILPFKNDYIFKTMLTQPGAELMRNSMLSAFTGLSIVKSELMANEPPIDLSYSEKPIRFDVNCITDTGKRLNIEMQAHRMPGDSILTQDENLRIRSIYYTSKLFILQKAKQYKELNQTFQIMICDFNVYDDNRFIHRFKFADNDTVLSDICCIIYVELPKIKDRLNKPFAEMTDDERWTFLIEYIDDEKFSAKAAEFEEKEEYRMAMRVLNTISNDEKQQIGYLSYLMNEMDYIHGMSASMEEGIAKGIVQGIAQGITQGIAQGEQKARLDMAKKMLHMKMNIEEIVTTTELPLETVIKLQESN